MANTHTPGPWTVDFDAEGAEDCFSVWYDVDGTGAEIAGRIGEEANAHLIAAAPEMLAALEDIVRYVSPGDDIPFAAMLEEARAAIAKAKGEL